MNRPIRLALVGLLALVAATTASGFAVWTIEPEVDFVDTVPQHSGLEPYRALLQELDGVRFLAIYQAHDPASNTDNLRGEAFDTLVLEQEDLEQRLRQKFPGDFGHTLSVVEGMRQGHYMLEKIATAGNPRPESYSVPEDQTTYDTVKGQVLGDDTLDDVLAQDGSSAISLFFIRTTSDPEARALVHEATAWLEEWAEVSSRHPVTSDHQPTGLVRAQAYTDSINEQQTRFWAPIALGGVTVALLWVLRGPGNVLIATTSLAVALTWTFGTIGLLGIRISFLTVFLAPIVVGIGIDHAIHILHRFDDERRGGNDRIQALRRAVASTGPAVLVSGTTTAVGVGALLFVPAPLFAEIGQVGVLGILLGLLAAFTVVPVLRILIPHAKPRLPPPNLGERLRRVADLPPKVAWTILVVLGLAAAIVAATQTTVESGSRENEFPQDDPVIALQQRIESEYGAFQRAYLVVQGPIADESTLHTIHATLLDTANLPLWRESSAITTILLADEATDQGAIDIALAAGLGAAGQSRSDAERLPQTDAQARQRLDALFDDPLWRTIAPFTINEDYTLTVIVITIDPWPDQDALRGLRDALVVHAEALQDELGNDYQVAAAGSPMNRAAILDQTPTDVSIAILGAGLGVGIVLTAAWARRPYGRTVAAATVGLVLLAALILLATIPVLDAIYAWGHDRFGWPANNAALNNMFLLAFAVTVAIGVDDMVHLAHRTWQTGSVADALDGTGRAITGTTLTTAVAFGLMSGVYFLQSKNLAILITVGVIVAYGLTLLIAPLALRSLESPGD